jgi:glycine betaine catabolism B
MESKFVQQRLVAKNTIAVSFTKPENFTYQAGQFVELTLPHKQTDSRGEKRWFTLSSSPDEEILTITTKRAPSSSSFKEAVFNSRPGAPLRVSDPMGDFVLPRNESKQLLFVAGGIGVTPFRSMCATLSPQSNRPITMLYAAKSQEEFAYLETLKNHATVHEIIGTLTSDLLLDTAKELSEPMIYISGPEPMVASLYEALKHTYSQSQLLCDYFPNYTRKE